MPFVLFLLFSFFAKGITACVEDKFFPNQNEATAAIIDLNKNESATMCASSLQYDWFTVKDVDEAPGFIIYEFEIETNTKNKEFTSIDLKAEMGGRSINMLMASGSSNTPPNDFTGPFKNYFIQPYDGSKTDLLMGHRSWVGVFYEYSVQFRHSTTIPAEYEAATTKATAIQVQPNLQEKRYLASGAPIWFKLTVKKDDEFGIAISTYNSGRINITGVVQREASRSFSGFFVAPAAGTVFVEIVPTSSSASMSMFGAAINHLPFDQCAHDKDGVDVKGQVETVDTFDSPRPLVLGERQESALCSFVDKDYFTFTLAKATVLELLFERFTSGGVFTIWFKNAEKQSYHVWSTPSTQSTKIAVPMIGKIIVEVETSGSFNPNGPLGHYALTLTEAPCPYTTGTWAKALTPEGVDVSADRSIGFGFCPESAGEHRFNYGYAPRGTQFALRDFTSGDLKSEGVSLGSDVTLELYIDGVKQASAWIVTKENNKVPTQVEELQASGQVQLRVTRKMHASSSLQRYSLSVVLAPCLVDPMASSSLRMQLTVNPVPLQLQRCVTASSGTRESIPKVHMDSVERGLYKLKITIDDQPITGSVSVRLNGKPHGRTNEGDTLSVLPSRQYNSMDTLPIERTSLLLLGDPAENYLDITIGTFLSVGLTLEKLACDETSPILSLDNNYLYLSSSTVAEAQQKAPMVKTAVENGKFLTSVICDNKPHYYAIGSGRTVTLKMQRYADTYDLSRSRPPIAEFFLADVASPMTNVTDRYALPKHERSTLIVSADVAVGTDLLLVMMPVNSNTSFHYSMSVTKASCDTGSDEELELTVDGPALSGVICPKSDRDRWNVDIDSPGIYRLTVSTGEFKDNTSPYIYYSNVVYKTRQDRQILLSTSCNGGSISSAGRVQTCEFSAIKGFLTGEFRINTGTLDTYSIRVERVSECFEQGTESETLEKAQKIQLNTGVKSSFCGSRGDSHYYLLPELGAGVITMQLNSLPAPRDPIGWFVSASVVSVTDGEPIPGGAGATLHPQFERKRPSQRGVAIATGSYAIRIKRANHTKSFVPPTEYTLTVRWSPCTMDQLPVNDDLVTATPLALGDLRAFSLCPPSDEDFYRIDIPETGHYKITIVQAPALMNSIATRAFHPSGTSFSLVDVEKSGNELSGFLFAPKGVNHLRVYGSSRTGGYSLLVDKSTDKGNDCPPENNVEKATTRGKGLNLMAYPGERRIQGLFCNERGNGVVWFKIQLFSTYSFLLHMMPDGNDFAGGEIEMALFKKDATEPVLTVSAPDSVMLVDTRALGLTSTGASLRITRKDHNTQAAPFQYWTLSVQADSNFDEIACQPDEFETETSTYLEVPSTIDASFCPKSEADRYFVHLPGGAQALTFTVEPAGNLRYINVKLGTETIANKPTDGSNILTLANPVGGTYEVQIGGNRVGNYSLVTTAIGAMTPPSPKPTPALDLSGVCGDGIKGEGEACDGEPCCKIDCTGFKDAGVSCRFASTVCDADEVCDGKSALCPTIEVVAAAGKECRPAVDECDVAEQCDGVNKRCPRDTFQAEGTTCDDKDMCTENDQCKDGFCRGTFALCDCSMATDPDKACDDFQFCTEDKCVGTKCVNTPVEEGTLCSSRELDPAPECLKLSGFQAPTLGCTAEGKCAAMGDDAAAAAECPGTPPCSGRGVCCSGKCACPTDFSGAECEVDKNGKIAAPPPAPTPKRATPMPTPKPVTLVAELAGVKIVGKGTPRATLSIGKEDDPTVLVFQASGGTVGQGDEAIGVDGSDGDADQIEHPETLRVSLENDEAFQLRGILFSDFNPDRGDAGTVTLELYIPPKEEEEEEEEEEDRRKRQEDEEPTSITYNVTTADWAPPRRVQAIALVIAPNADGDGFGISQLDMVALPGLPRGPGQKANVIPPPSSQSPSDLEDDGFLLYILIGCGCFCCCLIVIGIIVAVVMRGGSDDDDADNQYSGAELQVQPTPQPLDDRSSAAQSYHTDHSGYTPTAVPAAQSVGVYGSIAADSAQGTTTFQAPGASEYGTAPPAATASNEYAPVGGTTPLGGTNEYVAAPVARSSGYEPVPGNNYAPVGTQNVSFYGTAAANNDMQSARYDQLSLTHQ